MTTKAGETSALSFQDVRFVSIAWSLPSGAIYCVFGRFILNFEMSKAEILEELPKLSSVELREICDRIWHLEEAELLSGRAKPLEDEKAMLDRELEDYSRNPAIGSSWEKVEARLKS